MKKTVCVLGVFMFSALFVNAQEKKVSLQAETRIDYQREYVEGNSVHDNSGFKGKYLNVILNADITDNLAVAYRQRLNKAHKDQSFFDATDWLYINWQATEQIELSAGKQVVGIGGYEYDRAPIDLYVCSEYWNNIPCYQLGVSAAYKMNEGKDKILTQVCESPFSKTKSIADIPQTGNHSDMYAYNLMWYGHHGVFNTIYSLNMIEYQPGKYINYIALGNRLDFGKVSLELDLMNRAVQGQTFFLKDCSVMGEVSYRPCSKLNIFAKATYDVNKAERVGDFCVQPGTEETILSGGLEYYPLKDNKYVRIHAVGSRSFGKNPNGAVPVKQTFVDAGVKIKLKVL